MANSIKKLWQIDNTHFGIIWMDGKEMHYKLSTLQESCPCALCHTGRASATHAKVNTDVRAKSIDSIGLYAMRIQFEEGCSRGIFDFDYLYSLGSS